MFLLCGCAQLPQLPQLPGFRPDAREYLDYYSKALAASPDKRELLWRAASGDDSSPTARLHRALLRSLPGHSGYDEQAAVNNLASLTRGDTPPEIQSVARMRLAEINNTEDCRREVDGLKQRLSKMVGIERKLSNTNGH